MKKVIILLFILGMFQMICAQNTDIETVREIQAEREMADWIESMLFPIVGDNVAIVDMTLRYPSEKLKVYGSTLDTERSLPGLPVARSSGVMPSEVAGEETYPTIVLSKIVTIYLSKNTTQEMEDFVRQNVASWVNINTEKGDGLDVKRVLNLKSDEVVDEEGDPVIQTQDYRNYILMIGAVLLLIILIFIIVFSSRMGVLAKSLKEVNIPGLENAIRPPVVKQREKSESASHEPIDVRILPEDQIKKKSVSFRFIEDLSPAGCAKLLSREKPEEAAYVLSQLSPQYVSRFFTEFEGNTDIILKAIIKGKQLPHNAIMHLYDRLQKTQQQIMEEEQLEFDNHSFVSDLVNYLPAESSKKLFMKVDSIDAGFASILRKDIFLLEDIEKLEKNQIEILIRNLDRDLLVNYLSIAPKNVKDKFFNAMTTRNQEIFNDELQHISKLTNEDIVNTNDQIIADIRRVLALV